MKEHHGKTTILANGIMLACDHAGRCGRYSVAIAEGRIRGIADRPDVLQKEFPDASLVDASHKLIVPGFVNAHHHGASFLLRTLTDGLHATLWNSENRLDHATERLVHASFSNDVKQLYHALYVAHVRSGTTSVGESPLAFDDSGFAHMIEGIVPSGVVAVVALQNWDQIRKAKEQKQQNIRFVISLGKEKDFTVYTFEQITKAAKELNLPLYADVAETQESVQSIRENFQRDIVTVLNSFKALRPDTQLVHANYVSEDEVRMIKNSGATIVACPRSTASKQTGYPSLRHLAKYGIRLALGTDWGHVDMLDEMRFMYRLPLVVPGLRTFTATEVIRMGTFNGAFALGLANELGSIETGKRANLTLLNITDARLPVLHPTSPEEDWARLLVEHLTTADISGVMIDGIWKIHDGKFSGSFGKQMIEDFSAIHTKFFPPPSGRQKTPQVEQKDQQQNVLPFLSDRATHSETGGFETGASPEAKSTPIIDINDRPSESPAPDQPRPKREPIKPELPKDTRRVFGEDEDFS